MKLTELVQLAGVTEALQEQRVMSAAARVIMLSRRDLAAVPADDPKPDKQLGGNGARRPVISNSIRTRIDIPRQMHADVDVNASVVYDPDRVFADELDSPPRRPPE